MGLSKVALTPSQVAELEVQRKRKESDRMLEMRAMINDMETGQTYPFICDTPKKDEAGFLSPASEQSLIRRALEQLNKQTGARMRKVEFTSFKNAGKLEHFGVTFSLMTADEIEKFRADQAAKNAPKPVDPTPATIEERAAEVKVA